MDTQTELKTIDDLDPLLLILREAVEEGPHFVEISRMFDARTLQQNKALHLYLSNMALKMADAGITQNKILEMVKDGFELPISMHFLKDMFKIVAQAQCNKKSTAKLSTKEMQIVYEIFNSRIGEMTGVSMAWPSRFGGIE